MEIQMPIEVLCEKCRNCPQLEILDQQDCLYAGGEHLSTEHRLSCKNLDRCKSTMRFLIDGGEQLKMKEVDEYAGVDLMGDSGRPVPDIRFQNQLREKVNPCLNCKDSPGNSGKPGNCLCWERLEYVDGDVNKI